MAFFLTVAVLAAAGNSASLPDPLGALAKSADDFAASIAKLDRETAAVVADAAVVHAVASNKTTREAVLARMGDALKAAEPSAKDYDAAEEAAFKAADEYRRADIEDKQAELKLKHARAWNGDENRTAEEENELEQLRNASRDAREGRAAAKKELESKVEKAERASRELLEATRKSTRHFESKVDELMRAARTHEAAAKTAMRTAIRQGRDAAKAQMKARNLSEQKGEEARELAEEWAENHEDRIEDSSDQASDDLERVYEPVKRLARHSLNKAERDEEARHKTLRRVLKRSARVELVAEEPEDETLVAQGEAGPNFFHLTSFGVLLGAAAGASLVAVSRPRMGKGLEQPLLG